MALINKIRERTGLLIGVITVGLILFLVGGDILGPNSVLLGSQANVVGEIAGEDITYEEYLAKIEEIKFNYQNQTGRVPSENELYGIREQAWQALVAERTFREEFEALGVIVSDEELIDMVQGRNISPELQQLFVDPATGQFDRNQVIQYLQQIPSMPVQQQAAWYNFERTLGPSRQRLKYENLILYSEYATEAEAKLEYAEQNNTVDITYLYINPDVAISDTLINVTDDALKSYLQKNIAKYETEDNRDFNYVSFSLAASAADSAALRSEIERLKAQLATSEEDSTFATLNTEGQLPFATYNFSNLPGVFDANVATPEEGQVYGPFINENRFAIYKVSDIYEAEVASARASHILIRTEGLDEAQKAEAKTKIEGIRAEINDGLAFATAARQYSEDGSANRGGDLGWFDENTMVEQFTESVFAAKSKGMINRVIETEYGYHLIEVTEVPTKRAIDLATIELEIIASDETRNEAFRNADYFAGNANDLASFQETAQSEGYAINQANGIISAARSFNNVLNAREVVRWLYNDATVGKVSPVFELDDRYVVAVMRSEVKGGSPSLDDVRTEVTTAYKREMKADMIIEKLKGKTTLTDMQAVFGNDANIYQNAAVSLGSNSLPSVGFAPAAIGKAFALEAGQISQPIKEEVGVVVVQVDQKTTAPEIGDYTVYKNQVEQKYTSRLPFLLNQALTDKAKVKDNRYKFF
ncbi:peptidylprolyl isomerase [Penaeicola halotolerans]|uniref:peptidylprolyl isomerase n=1 Tax=Penaeicola halotolerans TaxID=2793196 RepID=UPI001CF87D48|nr:SurA N-terminal domain-containing protein [Penaeicola halotolerans]